MQDVIYPTSCEKCIYRSYLFSELPNEDLALVNAQKREVSFIKGDVISRQGDKIERFMYLKEGLVKLSRTTDSGREQIISIARPLDFIGLLTVFSDKSFKYTITAIEPSSVCFFEIDLLQKLISKNGDFAALLLEKMSLMADNIISESQEIRIKHIRGRIAHVLLDFSENIYKADSYELPLSRKEIAELIGVSTENVIRALSEFRRDGLVRINGSKIEMLRIDMIRKIAQLG